jgi:glycosyltransferase involved in cell wall biosynthesis
VGGFCEAILDGETGRVVPPDDPRALADGVRWFIENRGIDFAGNIAAFTRGKMSWSSLADTIETFLNG